MLSFGKYKGKSLKQVIKNDVKYAQWIWKHKSNNSMISKLDIEDKKTLQYVITPLIHIRLVASTTEEIITELKNRGLLLDCYFDENKCYIKSVYCTTETYRYKENKIDAFYELVHHFYTYSALY